jgi:4-diphosphocytidyl-2-C-methyl-D-erythritol kinase
MKRYRSFAKINLHLEVAGRRADGYHALRTVFQTIDLADEMRIDRRQRAGVELRVEGADLPTDERNLAVRAARLVLDEWAPRGCGVAIELRKRIPPGGGLGGGSANAATALLALVELFGLAPGPGPLRAAARSLGADVPFFLVGGTALGTGRGDEIRPLPDAPQPRGELVLLLSHSGLSTAAVFAALAASAAPAADAERPFEWPPPGSVSGEFAAWIGENALEAPAFRLRPELGALYTAAVRSGARRVRMSGSGSALFALYENEGDAARAAGSWPPDVLWKRVETMGRAAWLAASGLELAAGGA